jgi:hypothetical protein
MFANTSVGTEPISDEFTVLSTVTASKTRSAGSCHWPRLVAIYKVPVQLLFFGSQAPEQMILFFSYSDNVSLDSSCSSSPPVHFLQELPSFRSVARRRTAILSRDRQGGTLLKPTDSFSSQLEGGVTENLNSQSIRKYALNISEKRRLRFVQ